MEKEKIIQGLTEIIGKDRVIQDEEVILESVKDYIGFRRHERLAGIYNVPRALCVVRVANTDQASKILAFLNANEIDVVPRTGGSSVTLGIEPIDGGVILDGSDMDQLIELSEYDMQVTVQCGMPLEKLENFLNQKGYTSGHFPQCLPLANIGGLIATRSIGQFSTLYGGIEELVVGLEAVMPTGEVVRIKNVPRRAAGPDLRHLFIGSEGALAFITEATLKIFPYLPDERWMHAYAVKGMKNGLDLIRDIMVKGYKPAVIRLHDQSEVEISFGGIAPSGYSLLLFLADGPKSITDATGKAIMEVVKDYDTILVVDDHETNCDLLARQLEVLGYQAVRATNGKQAIAMIQQGIYDLILLDILMPELNGYEVLQWLKQSSWRHIPVIMISAVDEIDSVIQCIEMGAEDYLSKPFNPTLLKARIGACLQKKQWRDQETLYLAQLAAANAQISQLNGCLQAENMRLSTELEVTQRLQTMMLPQEEELNLIEQLEIAGFMQPTAEVGGDYYDVLQYGDRIIIGIGDATGHGLESGVLMLMVQTAVRTLIENNETEPKKYFEVLNRTIYKNLQRMNSDKNLTLCLVDYQDGILSFSGQHEELIVVRSGGIVERIDTINLGFPLGLEATIQDFIFQTQIELNPGDLVVLYTDGVTEAENHLGVQYGIDRLCSVIQHNWQKSASEIRRLVIESLHEYIGVHKIYDDITLVVVKHR